MKKEHLNYLYNDFTSCKNFLQSLSSALRKDGVTNYPIFVAMHEDFDIDIGVPVLRSEEIGTYYSFNASHLEDFVNKNIIQEDKVAVFISNYKDAEKFCCIFLSDPEESSFLFMPYENDMVWEPRNRELLN